jgi:hypothetical protein
MACARGERERVCVCVCVCVCGVRIYFCAVGVCCLFSFAVVFGFLLVFGFCCVLLCLCLWVFFFFFFCMDTPIRIVQFQDTHCAHLIDPVLYPPYLNTYQAAASYTLERRRQSKRIYEEMSRVQTYSKVCVRIRVCDSLVARSAFVHSISLWCTCSLSISRSL